MIGEGGMGTVYEVRHRALGKRFALKALRQDLAQTRDRGALHSEARTAAAVSHPGLVEITILASRVGQVYFVWSFWKANLCGALALGWPCQRREAWRSCGNWRTR